MRLSLILIFSLLVWPVAAQDQGLPNDPACTRAFESCGRACSRQHGSDQAGLTGCSARCSTDRATCDAVAGYEKAKPWVREQIDQIRRFIEGFLGPETPSPPSRKGPNEGNGERAESL